MKVLGVVLQTFHVALIDNDVMAENAGRALSDWVRLVGENCLGLRAPKNGPEAERFAAGINSALCKDDRAVVAALRELYHLDVLSWLKSIV